MTSSPRMCFLWGCDFLKVSPCNFIQKSTETKCHKSWNIFGYFPLHIATLMFSYVKELLWKQLLWSEYVLSKSTWASLKLHIFKRIAKLKSFTFPTDCVTAFIVAPLSKKLMPPSIFILFLDEVQGRADSSSQVGLSFWSSCFLPLCLIVFSANIC